MFLLTGEFSKPIRHNKKRETCLLPVPRYEAVALPWNLEPTTRSPRRI